MEIRTTTKMTSGTLIKYMQSNMAAYNKLSEEVSSGNKVSQPSDDPLAAIEILQDNASISKLNGYNTNISTAQDEVNVTDGALTSIISSLEKAHDLAVQGANGTYGTTDLEAMQAQVDQIIQNLKDLGNTKYNGNYIFAGTKTSTIPFEENATGGMSYNGTPSTSNYKRYTQISESENVSINLSGDSVLGSYDSATATGTGAMKDLYTLSKALASGDSTAVHNTIDSIMDDIENVTSSRSDLAALTNRFTSTTTYNSNKITILKENKSNVQDIDMATTVTDLYTAQTVYQSSMSVVSNLLKLGSLWDYIG
ncbi:flagellar hook-associated protein FlgL [bacterium]|nr:flagellar hook-associated protein FlgL [bacterium]